MTIKSIFSLKCFLITLLLLSQVVAPVFGTEVSWARTSGAACRKAAKATKSQKLAACKGLSKASQRVKCNNKALKAYNAAIRKCGR